MHKARMCLLTKCTAPHLDMERKFQYFSNHFQKCQHYLLVTLFHAKSERVFNFSGPAFFSSFGP